MSLFGVILIARPASLFPDPSGSPLSASGVEGSIISTNATIVPSADGPGEVKLGQRFAAIGMALVGVCGAAWYVLGVKILH